MNKAQGLKSFLLNFMIKGTKSRLFTTRSVQELLWGYEDALLDRIASSGTDVERVFGLMYKVCTGLTEKKDNNNDKSSSVF